MRGMVSSYKRKGTIHVTFFLAVRPGRGGISRRTSSGTPPKSNRPALAAGWKARGTRARAAISSRREGVALTTTARWAAETRPTAIGAMGTLLVVIRASIFCRDKWLKTEENLAIDFPSELLSFLVEAQRKCSQSLSIYYLISFHIDKHINKMNQTFRPSTRRVALTASRLAHPRPSVTPNVMVVGPRLAELDMGVRIIARAADGGMGEFGSEMDDGPRPDDVLPDSLEDSLRQAAISTAQVHHLNRYKVSLHTYLLFSRSHSHHL